MGDWEAFYAAQLGAAAALGGLVFVGLSLNLKKILSYAWLPGRALLALLVISSFMLMPGQSLTALGLEIAAVGVLLFFVGSGMEIYALRKVNLQNRRPFIGNLVLPEIGILPFIFGGVLLLFGIESGFY